MLEQSHALITEKRPWGTFTTLLEESGFKVKKITVLPQARLSLQSHEHRCEHWVIVQGCALVTLAGEEKKLSQDQYIYIPQKAQHRIQNVGADLLILIEVQLGNYLGEDDIKRFQDDYHRL